MLGETYNRRSWKIICFHHRWKEFYLMLIWLEQKNMAFSGLARTDITGTYLNVAVRNTNLEATSFKFWLGSQTLRPMLITGSHVLRPLRLLAKTLRPYHQTVQRRFHTWFCFLYFGLWNVTFRILWFWTDRYDFSCHRAWLVPSSGLSLHCHSTIGSWIPASQVGFHINFRSLFAIQN